MRFDLFAISSDFSRGGEVKFKRRTVIKGKGVVEITPEDLILFSETTAKVPA
jgi:hypothetical protein